MIMTKRRFDTNALRSEVNLRAIALRENLIPKTSAKKVLCPFHQESQPSCLMNEQYFHCFACQAQGDVVELIQRSKGMDFVGAVRYLQDVYVGKDMTIEVGDFAYVPPGERLGFAVEPLPYDLWKQANGRLQGSPLKAILEAQGLPAESLGMSVNSGISCFGQDEELLTFPRLIQTRRMAEFCGLTWNGNPQLLGLKYRFSPEQEAQYKEFLTRINSKRPATKWYLLHNQALNVPSELDANNGVLVVCEGYTDGYRLARSLASETAEYRSRFHIVVCDSAATMSKTGVMATVRDGNKFSWLAGHKHIVSLFDWDKPSQRKDGSEFRAGDNAHTALLNHVARINPNAVVMRPTFSEGTDVSNLIMNGMSARQILEASKTSQWRNGQAI